MVTIIVNKPQVVRLYNLLYVTEYIKAISNEKSELMFCKFSKAKKSPGNKKLVKSNKLISRIIFLTKFHFLQFQKWPKINI